MYKWHCIALSFSFFSFQIKCKIRTNTKAFFESKQKIIDLNDISSFILSKYRLFFMLHLIKSSFFYHCSIHSSGICITFVFWLFCIYFLFLPSFLSSAFFFSISAISSQHKTISTCKLHTPLRLSCSFYISNHFIFFRFSIVFHAPFSQNKRNEMI